MHKLASQANLCYNKANIVVSESTANTLRLVTHLIRRYATMNTVPHHAPKDKLLNKPGVYIIINTINQHKYIGSSVNVRRRWIEHRSALNRGKSTSIILQRAWTVYGPDAFVPVILEYVEDKNTLTTVEQRYIDELQPEYNAQPIVNRPGPRIYSEATRLKISQALQGRTHSDEYKRNMSEIMTGREFTPEWIEHLKEAQARRIITDEDKAEFQRRMNEPEIVAKRIAAAIGKERTPEQCQRMHEAQQKRYQNPEARMAATAHLNTPEAIIARAASEEKRIAAIRATKAKNKGQKGDIHSIEVYVVGGTDASEE